MKHERTKICLVVVACILFLDGRTGARSAEFQSGRAQFSIQCNGLMIGYEIQSLFVLPKEELNFLVVDANWESKYSFDISPGPAVQRDERHWTWQAPENPGVYTGRLQQVNSGESVGLQVFVLVPYDRLENEYLNGYHIGSYPDPKEHELRWYSHPKGFIEVTEETREMYVTPHFQLQQFLCRQTSDFPKYLVLDERLLLKLETLLAQINLEGYHCRTLSISSGYRTPYYNHQLGSAAYSAHLWGRAADVYVDGNYDNRMDDLNRNGKHDLGDVAIVRDIAERLEQELRHQDKVGGIGIYDETDSHGPFVHIDVRGEPARWEMKNDHSR